jgi:hypothetical protein
MALTGLDEIIQHIDPASCSYQEWAEVGMALKHEGFPCSVWDDWSKADSARYHAGECEKKWKTFGGGWHEPVTGGTIIRMAQDRGWTPSASGRELTWEDEIREDGVIVDHRWLEAAELNIPDEWDPVQQLTTYLETLFDSTENVGYVTETWQKDGRFLPTKGCYDRTAGQLIEELAKCQGDLGRVIGDYNKAAGAWIRFNPLDGEGVKDANVTDYRFALIESDNMELEQQNALIRELELPVAALVYSGGKSLHAIVRIDAPDYHEYRKRVDFLFDFCQKNGLQMDRQNRNPSRLSRMPGVTREGKKQYLLDTNIGKKSWDEWRDWIEGVNDDLPEVETFSDFWDDLPELSPPLIDGILRQGHKMLLAGPSKAGKSYALIELCIALAEGKSWLGFRCAQGKVLYINLEVDRASCLHRFRDVYTAMKIKPANLSNIDIWNLRGKAVPMDKLAPKIIRRAAKKGYIAVIIDPIYKVITGDENSASEMSAFCNQFDKVCNELGCAVIYCHHHSKGGQGDKRSMDRASGSGVFARDPDALLDLIELEITEDLLKQQLGEAERQLCIKWLDRWVKGWENDVGDDDILSASKMMKYCEKNLSVASHQRLLTEVEEAKKQVAAFTAWRIEGTLREFPKFPPLNVWFRFPVHVADHEDLLKDLQSETSRGSPFARNFSKKKTNAQRKEDRRQSLMTAFSAAVEDGTAQVKDVAEYLGVNEDTVRNYVKENKDDFWCKNGLIGHV